MKTTRLSGVLDRIKEKKEKEKSNNIKEAFEHYFDNTWSQYEFESSMNDFDITEDSDTMFSGYYNYSVPNVDAGIDIFVDASGRGIAFTLNPYDYDGTTLEVPFADDSKIFEAVFGFSDDELFQWDDYDNILKTLEKLTGNPSLVKQFQKGLDAFLEKNYDKIRKIVKE